jgi:hypothetical protein
MATLQPNELWHSHLIQLSLKKRLREFEAQKTMSKVFGQVAQKRSTSRSWLNLLRVEKANSIMVPGTSN